MFGIGMPELLLIFVLALLVFGPKELPKIARTLGKAMAELRRASDELREGIQREIDLAEREEEKSPAPTGPAPSATHAEETPPVPEVQSWEAPVGAAGEAAPEREPPRAESGPSMTTGAAEPALAVPPSEATETPGSPEATPEDSSRAATSAPASVQPIESRNA